MIGGVVLIATAAVLVTNEANGLQRVVPGYTSTLQHDIEGSSFATKQLASITASKAKAASQGSVCIANSGDLGDCGEAAGFTGIVGWLNTPGDRPITLASLRHKVVLVDFWTYSCINCQRALPHVEAWYARYRADGLVVIGVHTPEFAFEHVISNVKAAAAQLGVRYPIAIDNNYATWDAYGNEGWPADYLVDGTGELRYSALGEGDYGATESLIRKLLVENRPGVKAPTADRGGKPHADRGDDGRDLSRLRPHRQSLRIPHEGEGDRLHAPRLGPSGILPDRRHLDGECRGDDRRAFRRAGLRRHGEGRLPGDGGQRSRCPSRSTGSLTRSFAVGGIPKLYTLAHSSSTFTGDMKVTFTKGIEAYDLTFG